MTNSRITLTYRTDFWLDLRLIGTGSYDSGVYTNGQLCDNGNGHKSANLMIDESPDCTPSATERSMCEYEITVCACEEVQPPQWWKNNSCAKQKSAGKCPKRVAENSKYCRKTCGVCSTEGQPGTRIVHHWPGKKSNLASLLASTPCVDLEPPHFWRRNSCAKQEAAGKCSKLKKKNSIYCRKTCGFCAT